MGVTNTTNYINDREPNDYQRGYRDGFQDGYAAAQKPKTYPQWPIPQYPQPPVIWCSL